LDQFSIRFTNLKPGAYHYELLIDDKFFENFSGSEIKQGRVNVRIELQKQVKMLVLDFKLEGTVNLICDRCLDDFDFSIFSTNKLVVKIGIGKIEETDEIIMIPETEHKINVAQFIYEYIHLALPPKRTHPEDENGFPFCNKEIIEKLKEHKNKEINEVDPRWDVLKNLNLN